jgi:hypothetical protein
MRKELKTTIYILIAIAVFIFAFVVCIRKWADTELTIHKVCFRRYTGTAILIDKGYYNAGCHWKPLDRPRVDERWGTCEDFNVGDINYNYPEASYHCD